VGFCNTRCVLKYTPLSWTAKRQNISKSKIGCEEKASNTFQPEADNLYKGIPILLATDLGSIAFRWLAAWVITLVVRWVYRGIVQVYKDVSSGF